MRKNFIFILIIIVCFSSCKSLRETSKKNSIINYSAPLSHSVSVKVIGIGQKVPDNAKLIGSVKVDDAGFTKTKNCTYQAVLNDAIEQARTMGGNLIQIIEHKEPDIVSTCHRIKVDVYLIPGEIREK